MARPLDLLSKKILSANECSWYDGHLDSLTVHCKLREDSVRLETCCGSWNRLLLGYYPGKISFILCATSDTLPTAVNLQRWYIQCDAKCPLCNCARPTTAHVLSGCPVALSQDHYNTYPHDQVLGCLVSRISNLLAEDALACIYADLPGMRASESPQGTVPISLVVTSYHQDIVIHHITNNSIALLELTCPLDSNQHLEAARDCKQSKQEYLQILSELDRLGIPSNYDTVEISVLGHYLPSTLTSLLKSVNKVCQNPCVESYWMKQLDF